MSAQLEKIDDHLIASGSNDVSCFVGVRNELRLLPYFLDHHRKLGIAWFFFMDNGSDDGTRQFLLTQPDCHVFHTEGSHFALNVEPPNWTNTLLNVFGDGNWCLSLDADEMFVYPHHERVTLPTLCEYLERTHSDALIASMIDMYGDGPIAEAEYDGLVPPLEAAPYLDPKPGWLRPRDGSFPPVQMFGGVRERVFWHGRFKREFPPCLTKAPLVKWKKGMRYLVAQHTLSEGRFSEVKGALLHFKFLNSPVEKSELSITENVGVVEKGLEERTAYVAALKSDPKLALKSDKSTRYRDSMQLVELGWTTTSDRFEKYSSRFTSGRREEIEA